MERHSVKKVVWCSEERKLRVQESSYLSVLPHKCIIMMSDYVPYYIKGLESTELLRIAGGAFTLQTVSMSHTAYLEFLI